MNKKWLKLLITWSEKMADIAYFLMLAMIPITVVFYMIAVVTALGRI